MKSKKVFLPDRIVLAEGYPWANGLFPEHFELTMRKDRVSGSNNRLNFPPELWNKDVSKYRLVLERIGI